MIYCSGSASRIRKFYSRKLNVTNYRPSKVIYDGGVGEIVDELTRIFEGDLIIFESTRLSRIEQEKIHTTTSNFIHDVLKSNSVDYLLCFGDKILKSKLIEDFRKKLINFHPSILPAFPGLYSIDQALKAEVAFLGNTAHFIDEGVDTGKIIVQTAMCREDYEEYEDVLELQFPMLKMILRDFLFYPVSNQELVAELHHREKAWLMPSVTEK